MLRGHQCVLVGSLVSRELLAPAWTADGNERAQPTTGPLEQAKNAEQNFEKTSNSTNQNSIITKATYATSTRFL